MRKAKNTAFSAALKRQKKHARRVLILTATPFSIRLEELKRMLTLIGGEAAHDPVRSFSRALDDLYSGNTARSPEAVAERLAEKAKAAVDALSSFVIRHGIDDLPGEQTSFGAREDWNIDVPPAKPEELELMLRMDRALRVAKDDGSESSKATNDPRFHVGWRHFDAVERALKSEAPQLAEPAKAVVENQLKSIKRLREEVGIHSKMASRCRRGEIHDRAGGEGGSLLPPSCDRAGTDGTPRLGIAQDDNTAMAGASLEEGLERSARTGGSRAPR